ncbi:MAG: alpha/beta hydrolase [Planctomycetaceae bacterium]|jgi:acetyl esterase/lipase|nr:alpha/beta hydrolase [Planctomycetaceae bacterium]
MKNLLIMLVMLCTCPLFAQTVNNGIKEFKDLEYAKIGDVSVKLDLYVPERGEGPFPLLVWIHGGGWVSGDKTDCPMKGLCNKDYAAASVEYRLSNVAKFPAQIEDCKAAIRWLKAHSKKYNLDPNRIGVSGGSAGGHLVNLLGTTGKIKKFDTGENLDQTSEVQAVCNYFGPTEVLTALDGFDPGTDLTKALVGMYTSLLGGPIAEKKELAIEASPLTYVDKNAAPFMHVHGTADLLVPVAQCEKFHDKLRQSGIESRMFLIPRGGHGGPEFFAPKMVEELQLFFDKHLKR